MSTAPTTSSRRRSNGDGSVRQRPDGRYEYRYRDRDGRRLSGYAATEAQAAEELRAKTAARDAGARTRQDRRMTVARALDDLIVSLEHAGRRPSTIGNYRRIAERYIVPELPRTRLVDLDDRVILDALGRIERRHKLAPSSMRQVSTLLASALRRARRTGRYAGDPMQGIELPRLERVERPIPGKREQIAILDHVAGSIPWHAAYALAFGTGLRAGELAGLRWIDVEIDLVDDHGRGSVVISGQWTRSNRRGPTKSGKPRRLIIPAELVRILRDLRTRRTETTGRIPRSDAYLLASPRLPGRPMATRSLGDHLHGVTAELGLPPYRWHDLRHAAATMAIESGQPIALVSRYLGHASIGITADLYGHHEPSALGELVELPLRRVSDPHA